MVVTKLNESRGIDVQSIENQTCDLSVNTRASASRHVTSMCDGEVSASANNGCWWCEGSGLQSAQRVVTDYLSNRSVLAWKLFTQNLRGCDCWLLFTQNVWGCDCCLHKRLLLVVYIIYAILWLILAWKLFTQSVRVCDCSLHKRLLLVVYICRSVTDPGVKNYYTQSLLGCDCCLYKRLLLVVYIIYAIM